MADLIPFLGRFHVVVLHLPIGLLTLTAGLEIYFAFARRSSRPATLTPLWLLGTLAAGGHEIVMGGVQIDPPTQLAGGGVARHHGRAGFAARENVLISGEQEFALGLGWIVATGAALFEDRLHDIKKDIGFIEGADGGPGGRRGIETRERAQRGRGIRPQELGAMGEIASEVSGDGQSDELGAP